MQVDQLGTQCSATVAGQPCESEDLSHTGKLPSLSSWASEAANGDKKQWAAMFLAAADGKVCEQPLY